jgi:hypothetical protein
MSFTNSKDILRAVLQDNKYTKLLCFIFYKVTCTAFVMNFKLHVDLITEISVEMWKQNEETFTSFLKILKRNGETG